MWHGLLGVELEEYQASHWAAVLFFKGNQHAEKWLNGSKYSKIEKEIQ